MRRPARLGLALALLGVLATGCGDDGPTPPTSTPSATATTAGPTPSGSATSAGPAEQIVEVAFVGGKVVRDSRRVPVRKGQRVRLIVNADITDEVHLHKPYDLTAAVTPSQPAVIVFTANIAGVVVAELHEAGKDLVELEIR